MPIASGKYLTEWGEKKPHKITESVRYCLTTADVGRWNG